MMGPSFSVLLVGSEAEKAFRNVDPRVQITDSISSERRESKN